MGCCSVLCLKREMNMFRLVRPRIAFALMTSFLFFAARAIAQETISNAIVTGRVLDPSGASIPHATVTALQSATNETFTTQTDDQGRFRLLYLPVGQYRIQSQSAGFAASEQTVDLSIGSAFDITLKLALAGSSTHSSSLRNNASHRIESQPDCSDCAAGGDSKPAL